MLKANATSQKSARPSQSLSASTVSETGGLVAPEKPLLTMHTKFDRALATVTLLKVSEGPLPSTVAPCAQV